MFFLKKEEEKEGIFLGKAGRKVRIDDSKNNVLVFGKSGKSFSITLPTLLDTWNESAVVLDYEDRNYFLTSGSRKEKKDNLILRFAPNEENSCKFNILSEIRIFSEYEEEDIKNISENICEIETNKNYDMITYYASKILNIVINYVVYREFLKEPKFYKEFNIENPYSIATMQNVIDFIKSDNFKENLKNIFKENIIEKYGKNDEIKKYVTKKIKEKNELENEYKITKKNEDIKIFSKNFEIEETKLDKKFEDIVDILLEKLKIFEKEKIKENTSNSDFRIFDLMNYEKPISLYLQMLLFEKFEIKPLIRIILTQISQKLTPELDFSTGTFGNEKKLLLVLDKVEELDKIDFLETSLEKMAAYGIKSLLISSELKNLNNIYGESNEILEQCRTKIFFNSSDKKTIEYANKLAIRNKKRKLSDLEKLSDSDILLHKIGFKNEKFEKITKILFFYNRSYEKLSKLPYIYSESCYDKKKQYIKLTKEQKEKYIEYPYNYIPTEYIKQKMKKDLEKEKNIIFEKLKEQENMSEKELKYFSAEKDNFQRNYDFIEILEKNNIVI